MGYLGLGLGARAWFFSSSSSSKSLPCLAMTPAHRVILGLGLSCLAKRGHELATEESAEEGGPREGGGGNGVLCSTSIPGNESLPPQRQEYSQGIQLSWARPVQVTEGRGSAPERRRSGVLEGPIWGAHAREPLTRRGAATIMGGRGWLPPPPTPGILLQVPQEVPSQHRSSSSPASRAAPPIVARADVPPLANEGGTTLPQWGVPYTPPTPRHVCCVRCAAATPGGGGGVARNTLAVRHPGCEDLG